MIKQTKQNFRIYIVLLIEVRIFFPKCSVVRDDAVLDANSGLDQDRMIVAGDDLGTVSDQTAMAHYSDGCEQFGVFIKYEISEIGFQELLIGRVCIEGSRELRINQEVEFYSAKALLSPPNLSKMLAPHRIL